METNNRHTKSLNNIYAWILAFIPICFGIPNEEYANYAALIGSLAAIGLLVADRMAISESGYEPPAILWGIVLMPVYLWKRATITKSSRLPFIIVVALMAGLVFIVIPKQEDSVIEDAACPVVTTILKEHNGSTAAKCIKVKIDDKVTDKFYRATATLDNGNDINITLELAGREKLYVRVPGVYLND
ncbi:hypothetical protein MA999_003979 [Escherichia coli]|uniref:hypothetical protein n=1 Tax=Escherichia coli TaxID=562 RepID=UPI0010ABB280|nr:hypothetical protein [Escherichia coli]EEW3300136.1 hypothetical protein [Escherichia coli]EGQ6009696.1 hypothetical protein [Escherichia coli]EGQ6865518.1 hypothetical protein [Escherichia coli]EGQ6874542.1 hypothetical protein [Escherichia coli]EIV8254465.1 hypothetical protein [Escherichia coli]